MVACSTSVRSLARCLVANAAARGGPLALLDASLQAKVSRKAAQGAKRAAVLVPITCVDGEPAVVFQCRSGKVSTHRYQVAFPGGHLEDGESAVEAAFREAEEELGSEFRRGFEFVDLCNDVLAVTGTVVTPVLAVRDEPLDLTSIVASEEVSSVFALPLDHLLSDCNREVRAYEGRGQIPVFLGGPDVVWGLTAFILDGVLRDSVAPCWSNAPS